MLTLTQRRARGAGKLFNSDRVLEAGSLNVPAGTTVRRPSNRRAFDFSGYDTISVYFTVSNMAAGDSLTLRINSLDPESQAGDPIPGQLFARDLITVSADGDYVATISLPSYYSGLSAATQFLRPAATRTRDAWVDEGGGTVDIHNSINETAPNDVTYVGHGRTLGTVVFDLSAGADPGVNTGHFLRIRNRITTVGNGNDHLVVGLTVGGGFSILNDGNWPGQVTAGWTGNPQITPNAGPLDSVDTTYTYALDAAEAALITDYTTLRVNWTYYTGFDAATGVIASWCELEVPPAGGGGGTPTKALPMYLNLLELVNTGATDVTVDNCIIELTRS